MFSVAADGRLHMRYTARTRSIAWKDEPAVRAATATLLQVLESDPRVLRVRLEPGMGIVCNNVLHDRAAFTDSATHRRLILRFDGEILKRVEGDVVVGSARPEAGGEGKPAKPPETTAAETQPRSQAERQATP